MPLLKEGLLAEDAWSHVAEEGVPLPDGAVTVPLGRFLAESDALLARNAPVGVRLAPSDEPAALRPFLDRLSLIEVHFPRYTDGRGFSHAQLLRLRLGYRGEIRAVGHVLRDMLGFMERTGFDAMLFDHPDPERAYRETLEHYSLFYRTAADGRPNVFEQRHARGRVPAAPRSAPAPETPAAHAARLNSELRGAGAQEIIRVALREFAPRATYVSSFGAESAAMLGLIAEVDASLPIIFIDTGMHFGQTLQYRDELIRVLGLTGVRTVHPAAAEVKAVDPRGVLHKTAPDECCEVRKVRPLEPALEGFDAWFTGRKRFHGGGRIHLPVAEFTEGRFKFNPLANWSPEQVTAYLAERALPPHPLVAEGYPSIGCWPCTVQPTDPGDVRSGRWAGQNKKECGLHVERKDRPRVF